MIRPVRRPDDKSGRAFRKLLEMVERRAPPRAVEHTDLEWKVGRLSDDAGDEHYAVAGNYMLQVIEVGEEFLANEPPQVPRVSWSVYTCKDWKESLLGGIAPSVAVAKARTETLLRAIRGYKRA